MRQMTFVLQCCMQLALTAIALTFFLFTLALAFGPVAGETRPGILEVFFFSVFVGIVNFVVWFLIIVLIHGIYKLLTNDHDPLA